MRASTSGVMATVLVTAVPKTIWRPLALMSTNRCTYCMVRSVLYLADMVGYIESAWLLLLASANKYVRILGL